MAHLITQWAALDPALLVREIKAYIDDAILNSGGSPPQGDIAVDGDLSVSGTLRVSGDVLADSTLVVSGGATLGGNLTVDGTAVIFLNLPNTDPHIAGALYLGKQNALTVSAG